jgi:glycosyltransferase involved in cell wall biosynthesis
MSGHLDAPIGESRASDSRPLRVCIVQPVVPAYRRPIFERLSRQPGIQLTILAGQRDRRRQPRVMSEKAIGYSLHAAPTTRVGPLLSQPAIWSAMGSRRFDVVVLSWNTRYLQLWPALMRSRVTGVKVILWGHGQSLHDNAFRRWFRELPLRVAEVGVLYGHSAADRLTRRGVDERRVAVAPNALDQTEIREATARWLADPGSLPSFQRREGISDKEVILYVSRLTPGRHLDVLFRALAAIRSTHPALQLVIVGDGPDRENVQRAAHRLGIANSITFVGRLYDEEQLAPWFLSARLLAYPPPIGLSLLHAFGYGLPVVTGDDAAHQRPEFEHARHGYNSLLYKDGDPVAFAARISEILSSRELRDELSKGALATVGADAVGAEAMISGFMGAIQRLPRTRRRPPRGVRGVS